MTVACPVQMYSSAPGHFHTMCPGSVQKVQPLGLVLPKKAAASLMRVPGCRQC